MFMIDITGVRHINGRQLELTFADGLKGVVDMKKVISQFTGIFEPLLDQSYFLHVSLNAELGTIVWP